MASSYSLGFSIHIMSNGKPDNLKGCKMSFHLKNNESKGIMYKLISGDIIHINKSSIGFDKLNIDYKNELGNTVEVYFKNIEDLESFNIEGNKDITVFNVAFRRMTNLTTFAIEGCNVNLDEIYFPENLENLEGAFRDSRFLKDTIFHFNDCKKLWTMENMFENVRGIRNADRSITIEALPSLTTMSEMFKNCKDLICAPNLINLDNLTIMASMFENCTSLEVGPLTDNSLKPVDCSYMFSGCENLKCASIKLDNNDKLINVSGMFEGCVNLVYGCSFIDCFNLENASHVYYNCQNLEYYGLSFYGCVNLRDFSNAFTNCTKLSKFPNLEHAPLNNIYSAFEGCKSITKIPNYFTANEAIALVKKAFMNSGIVHEEITDNVIAWRFSYRAGTNLQIFDCCENLKNPFVFMNEYNGETYQGSLI